jgi:hypothetical protein
MAVRKEIFNISGRRKFSGPTGRRHSINFEKKELPITDAATLIELNMRIAAIRENIRELIERLLKERDALAGGPR